MESDPDLSAGHHIAGLLAERQGRLDDADAAFARATRLDPESFPRPVRLDHATFARHLAEAIDRLPSPFREALDEVAVTVEPVPDERILLDADPPLDPEILGLFAGLPRSDRGVLGPGGELPGRIYLFQRSLERWASDEGELVEQIGITLRHELGHYLGLDEDEIEAAGHA
jgi:predicted Zn-dependent protease with MMP-like domain